MKISKLIYLVVLLFILPTSYAQTQFKAVPGDENSILIEGTSNIHDWEIQVDDFESQFNLVFNNKTPEQINSMKLSIPVKSFNSGKGRMDKNTYNAMDADTHESIVFTSSGQTKLTANTSKSYRGSVSGNLSIAGTTKKVEISIELEKTPKGFILKAKHELKMPDYGIDPPTALLGTISTGENVTINFNLAHYQH